MPHPQGRWPPGFGLSTVGIGAVPANGLAIPRLAHATTMGSIGSDVRLRRWNDSCWHCRPAAVAGAGDGACAGQGTRLKHQTGRAPQEPMPTMRMMRPARLFLLAEDYRHGAPAEKRDSPRRPQLLEYVSQRMAVLRWVRTLFRNHHRHHDCQQTAQSLLFFSMVVLTIATAALYGCSVSFRSPPASGHVRSLTTNNCKILYVFDCASLCQQGPYHDDSTASRLLSEVKHRRARLVLRWGTTLESRVFLFLQLFLQGGFLNLCF